jgi:hypothetical protein
MPKLLKERQQSVIYYVSKGSPENGYTPVMDAPGRIEAYTSLRHLEADWCFGSQRINVPLMYVPGTYEKEVYVIRKGLIVT